MFYWFKYIQLNLIESERTILTQDVVKFRRKGENSKLTAAVEISVNFGSKKFEQIWRNLKR